MACSKKCIIWTIIVAIAIIGISIGIYFCVRDTSNNEKLGRGAIVSNGVLCAPIGKSILEEGGSAVDAAIAILLCEGVILPHSTGVGGGFFAIMYNKKANVIDTVIARDAAPLAATKDMFVNQTNIKGAKLAAVPSELLGFWNMHQKYGKLPWKRLFEPSVKLCRNGHPVSVFLHNAAKKYETELRNEPSMNEIFIDPSTGNVWNTGDTMKRERLAQTFEIIAEKGVQVLYGGSLGKMLVEDIQNSNGILSMEDLQRHSTIWMKPIKTELYGGYKVFTTTLPSSGILLSFILNLLNKEFIKNKPVMWHRLVESFKHAYGQRTHLGDMGFNEGIEEIYEKLLNSTFVDRIRDLIFDDRTSQDYEYYGANFTNTEDHGTASISVLAPNGDAITITSTVNTFFGCKVRSKRTGIILNDSMDDFSTPGLVNAYGVPPSPANFIKPRKRPMSAMTPTIVLNKNDEIELLIGAAGGTMITTSLAQVLIRYLYLNETISDAVNGPRLHHQLAPMHVDYEYEFDQEVIDFLNNVGHKTVKASEGNGFSALTAIGVKDPSNPIPVFDNRRPGSVATL